MHKEASEGRSLVLFEDFDCFLLMIVAGKGTRMLPLLSPVLPKSVVNRRPAAPKKI
jgi:hypothetical protein